LILHYHLPRSYLIKSDQQIAGEIFQANPQHHELEVVTQDILDKDYLFVPQKLRLGKYGSLAQTFRAKTRDGFKLNFSAMICGSKVDFNDGGINSAHKKYQKEGCFMYLDFRNYYAYLM